MVIISLLAVTTIMFIAALMKWDRLLALRFVSLEDLYKRYLKLPSYEGHVLVFDAAHTPSKFNCKTIFHQRRRAVSVSVMYASVAELAAFQTTMRSHGLSSESIATFKPSIAGTQPSHGDAAIQRIEVRDLCYEYGELN